MNLEKNRKFKDFLDKICDDGPLMLYRGQSRDLQPLPKLERDMNAIGQWDKIKYMESVLEEFKIMSYPYLEQFKPDSTWEWLSLAQHHGLSTCLLDWSDNPIIALYFAVRDDNKHNVDGAIYRYYPGSANIIRLNKREKEKQISIYDIFNEKGNVLYPIHITRRIVAQSGVFTIDTLNDNLLKDKILISKEDKKLLKDYLYDLSINESTLFPSLDGVSSYINWKLLNHEIRP